MSRFQAWVESELARARESYGDIRNYHEGYAVLLEEVDEFWDQVKKWPRNHSESAMRMELVQIAAMAQRIAEDTLGME